MVAAEYQEHFGEHAYDDEGNYIGPAIEHSSEAEEAWAEYYAEHGGSRRGAEPPSGRGFGADRSPRLGHPSGAGRPNRPKGRERC